MRDQLLEELEALLGRAIAATGNPNLARDLIARDPYNENAYAALIATHLAGGSTRSAIDLVERYLTSPCAKSKPSRARRSQLASRP